MKIDWVGHWVGIPKNTRKSEGGGNMESSGSKIVPHTSFKGQSKKICLRNSSPFGLVESVASVVRRCHLFHLNREVEGTV